MFSRNVVLTAEQDDSNEFDAWYFWLGVPKGEQPPNYYRLLSLEDFEHDHQVIDTVSKGRMAALRVYQWGPRAEIYARIMSQIVQARLCLLDPVRRRAYNRSIRARDPKTRHDDGELPVEKSQLLKTFLVDIQQALSRLVATMFNKSLRLISADSRTAPFLAIIAGQTIVLTAGVSIFYR